MAAEPDSVLLSIDSATRLDPTGTTSSDYHVAFQAIHGAYALRVVTAEVPCTQNIMTADNCVVDFVDDTTATTAAATLTQGMYTGAQLATELQTQMNALVAGAPYTVTFSSITQKLTVTRAAGLFHFLFATGAYASLSAAAVLGFSAADTTSAATATSDRIVQLQGETNVYLCLEGLGGILNSALISDVAAKVVFPTAARMATLQSLAAPIIVFPAPVPILRTLRVQFKRANGRLYDFQGLDNSFTVEIWRSSALCVDADLSTSAGLGWGC
jgi:hypothetical protein